jgi:hypothetical protein
MGSDLTSYFDAVSGSSQDLRPTLITEGDAGAWQIAAASDGVKIAVSTLDYVLLFLHRTHSLITESSLSLTRR